MRPHRIGQPRHPFWTTRYRSKASAFTLSANGNCARRRFIVGKSPTTFFSATRNGVPHLLRTAVPGHDKTFSVARCASRTNDRGGVAGLPGTTAIAFRYFDPHTAPPPQRAAALPPSLMTLEKSTLFSPAWPMLATDAPGCFACRLHSASLVERPHSSLAGRILTSFPGSARRYTGCSARPRITSAPMPHAARREPNAPPALA